MSCKPSPALIGAFEIKEVSDLSRRFSDLDKISDFYRRAYHATLGHFHRHAKKMKSSSAWQGAFKGLPDENKERLLTHQNLSHQQLLDFYKKTGDLEKQCQRVVGLDFGPRYVHIATADVPRARIHAREQHRWCVHKNL